MKQSVVCLLAVFTVLASAGTWQVLQKDLETIIIGVSFINETYGWIPGDQNGVGALFLRTQDGGNSWKKCDHNGNVTIPMGIAMKFTGTGQIGGVISGVGIGRGFPSMEFTTDGNTFQGPNPNPNLVGESQDAKAIAGYANAFALAGEFTNTQGKTFNGLTATYNGGASWQDYDAGLTTSLARYGSFPTQYTWYIAAGVWPEDLVWDEAPNTKVLSQKVRINKFSGKHEFRSQVMGEEKASRKLLQSSGYVGQIAKTTDGGKTWATVYTTNNFYFNDISCVDANNCWAVGESESDSPMPGVFIMNTNDGGVTWTTQMYNSNPEYSLMDIAMINATEGWAVGGLLSRSITGEFFHTKDGKTWFVDGTLSDEYATSLSFVTTKTNADGYLGWATALTIEGQSSVLAYK